MDIKERLEKECCKCHRLNCSADLHKEFDGVCPAFYREADMMEFETR